MVQTELLQTNHYYPFGMIHEGNQVPQQGAENMYKFNGTEHITDFDLDWNHTLFRTYDNALGRWHQIDPKHSERESPFVGLGNNPVLFVDVLGDTLDVPVDDTKAQLYVKQLVPKKYQKRVSFDKSTGEVSFDRTGLTEKDMKKGGTGMALLINLIDEPKRVLYSTTIEEINATEAYGDTPDDDNEMELDLVYSFPDATYPRREGFKYLGKYDGLAVTSNTTLIYYDEATKTKYEVKKGIALAFHALSEMYYLLTDPNHSYSEAHKKANDDAVNFHEGRELNNGNVYGYKIYDKNGKLQTHMEGRRLLVTGGKKYFGPK